MNTILSFRSYVTPATDRSIFERLQKGSKSSRPEDFVLISITVVLFLALMFGILFLRKRLKANKKTKMSSKDFPDV